MRISPAAAAEFLAPADRRSSSFARSGHEGDGAVDALPVYASGRSFPGFVDFTHVPNTGAAFGLLKTADFPFKTAVIAVFAAAAMVCGRHRTRRASRVINWPPASGSRSSSAAPPATCSIASSSDRWSISWTSTGGRITSGRSTSPTRRSRSACGHDSRYARSARACIQNCLSCRGRFPTSGRSRSIPTASCWPPPTCSACSWRSCGRRRASSTPRA